MYVVLLFFPFKNTVVSQAYKYKYVQSAESVATADEVEHLLF